MNIFEENIKSIHGQKGQEWLQALPTLVTTLATRLHLTDLKVFDNLTYNYVTSGLQNGNPVVLKLGLKKEALEREALALTCFKHHGAIKLLDQGEGFLLLQRAPPGASLREYFPNKEQESLQISYTLMQQLHQAKIPTYHTFPHVRDQLSLLDKEWNIPLAYLQKARVLRDYLHVTCSSDVLLHGDIHHDNILQNDESDGGWIVIDPNGLIGDPLWEIPPFIRNPIELSAHPNAYNIIKRRIAFFATLLAVPEEKIVACCFVSTILSWAWSLEDNRPIQRWHDLSKIFDTLSKI